MNRNLCIAAFAAGATAVLWVGAGYVGTNALALAMTAIIGAVYAFGALELRRFHRATGALSMALATIPEPLPGLDGWLAQLPPSLRNAVRLRIEGERVGLPGPSLTPYLAGLLVMLGMLGTFLGMVVTLNGAVLALEGTTDLAAIRAALAAPVKGLGLAFGTSVAGVAASAMLGLISALCRRERQLAGQLLDDRIATVLRGFSLAHRRQETFDALQAQSRALPEAVDRLAALMERLDAQNVRLNERLLADQERFYREAAVVHGELAQSVERSLKESLGEAARLAGAAIQPAVEATLAGLARETSTLHERMAASAAAQLDGLAERFDASAVAIAGAWSGALACQRQRDEVQGEALARALDGFAQAFEQRSVALLERVSAAQEALRADLAARDGERQAAMAQTLAGMAATLGEAWRQAGEQTQAQQAGIVRTLETTARDIAGHAEAQAARTIEEIARLAQAAAEAPRVAAETIGEMRRQMSDSIAQDNERLDERRRLMESLSALLEALNRSATEQRGAIEALVNSASTMLDGVGSRFAGQVGEESKRLADTAAQAAGSAVEVASLAEAFGFAVQRFGESSDTLLAGLVRIEEALEQSLSRSDEQLAYYVTQARELIDLSVMSQQRIVGDLQRLAGQPTVPVAGEA